MSTAENIIILDSDNSDDDSDLDDQDQRTIFCANFSSEVTEELLYELFLQAGPIEEIRIPKDSDGKPNKSYAFIIYEHKCTVQYALKLYEGVKLFNRTLHIKLGKRNIQKDNKQQQQQQNNNKNYIVQNNNVQNLYPNLLSNQQIVNPTYPMVLLDQGFNNTEFNNLAFNNFNQGLLNSNLGFNNSFNSPYNNFNPGLNYLNSGLFPLNQGFNNLNPSGLFNLNQGIYNFNPSPSPTINNLNYLLNNSAGFNNLFNNSPNRISTLFLE